MAKSTIAKKIRDTCSNFEKELDGALGKIRAEFAAEVAKLIPEGWYLTWSQSDDQYNDEDYYFGLDDFVLCSVREPRQGELVEEATANQTERCKDYYGKAYDHVTKYGRAARYKWVLDDDCKLRRGDPDHDDFGRVDLGSVGGETFHDGNQDNEEENLDLLAQTGGRELAEQLSQLLHAFGEDQYRKLFGDAASVKITADGKLTHNKESSRR